MLQSGASLGCTRSSTRQQLDSAAVPYNGAAGLLSSPEDSSCKSATTDSSRPLTSAWHATERPGSSPRRRERAHFKNSFQDSGEAEAVPAGPTPPTGGTADQVERVRHDRLSEAAEQAVRCQSLSGNSQASLQTPLAEPRRRLVAGSRNVQSAVGSTSKDAGKLRSLSATLENFEECRLHEQPLCGSAARDCPQTQLTACSAGCCRPYPSQQKAFAGGAATYPGLKIHCQAHIQTSYTCSSHCHSQLELQGRPYNRQHQPTDHGGCVCALSALPTRPAVHHHAFQNPEAAYSCLHLGCQASHTHAHEQWPARQTPGLSRQPLAPAMPSCCSLPAAQHRHSEPAQPPLGSSSVLCSCSSCPRTYAPGSLCSRDQGALTFRQQPSDMCGAPEHVNFRSCEATLPVFLPAACSSFFPELDMRSPGASVAHNVRLTPC